jgi:beta-lactamase class A
MITRRQLVAAASATVLAGALMPALRTARAATPADTLAQMLAAIEAKTGGRLGVAVHDTGSGLKVARRGDERFPLCSTFKLFAGAAILAKVDQGEENLDRPVEIRAADIATYSPMTEKHVGQAVPLGQLCEAAITLSDNTAANLILGFIGGPEGFNAFMRSLGDTETRIDRVEPALNEAVPGDPRDTTTPTAMAETLKVLLMGDALTAKSRDQLTAWLIANKTGDTRLRAGLPEGWRTGDKTGTCNASTANDIGILWPPDGAPILIAVYLAEAKASRAAQNAAIADVARAVAAARG